MISPPRLFLKNKRVMPVGARGKHIGAASKRVASVSNQWSMEWNSVD